MNKVREDILRNALRRIALGQSGNPRDLAIIASTALQDAALVIDYQITARTWFGEKRGYYKAELTDVDGNVIIRVSEPCTHPDAWQAHMAAAMGADKRFPDYRDGDIASIYFREVCNVPYTYREVQRRKDL